MPTYRSFRRAKTGSGAAGTDRSVIPAREDRFPVRSDRCIGHATALSTFRAVGSRRSQVSGYFTEAVLGVPWPSINGPETSPEQCLV
jgi:hypothetical protein